MCQNFKIYYVVSGDVIKIRYQITNFIEDDEVFAAIAISWNQNVKKQYLKSDEYNSS